MSSKSRRARFARDTGGGSAVEFALVAPILMLLAVGIIQFGWILHCAASVRWALEASSRSLMLDPSLSSSQLQSAMIDRLTGLADPTNLTVSVTSNAANNTLVVQSSYVARLALPMIPVETMTFRNSVAVPAAGG